MAYTKNKMSKSTIKSVETVEGETIEQKIERFVNNKEPMNDGAPEIFTERNQGVVQAYNIRTDRWEVAADAMDAVARSKEAKRDARFKPKMDEKKEGKDEKKEVKKESSSGPEGKDTGGKSIQGDLPASGQQ